MTTERTWETITCSRCRGSGQYSYCQMHGTTCFKCSGKGRVYSRRALIARQWLEEQLQLPIEQAKVGQRVFVEGVGKFTIHEAGKSAARCLRNGEWVNYYEIRGQKLGYCGIPGETFIQLLPTAEQVAAAIKYQEAAA